MIRTSHIFPPIPDRSHDWAAYNDDDCQCSECHPRVGYGATETKAMADYEERCDE